MIQNLQIGHIAWFRQDVYEVIMFYNWYEQQILIYNLPH